MQYTVQIVADHELPNGVERVIVEREDGSAVMLINGNTARCWSFMRAWEDSLEPCTVPTVLLPERALLYAV